MYLTLKHQKLCQLSNVIETIALRQADAVVIKNINSPILDHYAIFLGWDSNTNYPIFIANYPNGGVRVVPHEETVHFLSFMRLSRPRRFEGNDYQRKQAIERAFECVGQKTYNFPFNNCEHFVNYVQKGIAYSQQTRIVSSSVAAAGALALLSKNPVAQVAGGVALGVGLFSLFVEVFGDESF